MKNYLLSLLCFLGLGCILGLLMDIMSFLAYGKFQPVWIVFMGVSVTIIKILEKKVYGRW